MKNHRINTSRQINKDKLGIVNKRGDYPQTQNSLNIEFTTKEAKCVSLTSAEVKEFIKNIVTYYWPTLPIASTLVRTRRPINWESLG